MDATEQTLDSARKMHRSGRADLAEPMYRAVLRVDPDNAEAWHLLGVVMMQRREPDKAEPMLRKSIALDGSKPKPYNNLGVALSALRKTEECADVLRMAVELDPEFFDGHFNLGNAVRDLGRRDEAIECYLRALEINPAHTDALNNLGMLLQQKRDYAGAEARFRKAVELAPRQFEYFLNLANLLELRGKVDEAVEMAKALMAGEGKNPLVHLLAARLERRQGLVESAVARLRFLLTKDMPATVRLNVLFEYGHGLDRLDKTKEAFAAYAQANAMQTLVAKDLKVDFDDFRNRVERAKNFFTGDRIAAWPAPHIAESPHRPPVFYVGFPRSGTTPFEQILAAHPNVVTTREASPLARIETLMERQGGYPGLLDGLDDSAIAFWRSRFWEEATAAIGGEVECKVLVDKLPLNIIRLGLANRLFPEARVVFAVRDPRDVVLSCFMQQFALNSAMSNFQDLRRAAETYAAVVSHWFQLRDALTMKTTSYRYEDLVVDVRAVVQEVLAFLELPWSDSLLAYREHAAGGDVLTPSFRDVNEGLYTRAVGRWRGYAEHLSPVLPILEPFVEALGYPTSNA